MIEEDNQEYDLLLDKYKNFFDQKSTFHNSQLQEKILPYLMELREKKADIVLDLKDAFELVSDVSEGTFDVEDTYSDALQEILHTKMQLLQPGVFDKMKF